MRRLIFATVALLHATLWGQELLKPGSHLSSFPAPSARADSIVDVIVEFVEEPMLLAAKNKFRTTGNIDPVYATRFGQFATDIGAVLPPSMGFAATVSRHQFTKTFFGVAVRLPQGSLSTVRGLSYVKKIHPNSPVRAFLDKSVPQIRANAVWSTFGTQGEGIVVGIIDTGIDYLLPALGGGIGPAFKVVGGYDLVNNDNDPMDDDGHGTHVAGIIAADTDALKGVAPKAKLYALKVLDANGHGVTADILAAIERTVDPNGDGDSSDRLDVVNLSLGSLGGDPDDAASTAIDNATKLGVTFCIAAGNAGHPTPVENKEDNYYYDGSETIASPGTSRLAITVGAVDSLDQPAIFSSKGPVSVTFGVKPDVCAPGVNITSLALGSGTTQLSGTSMATPHVAGVAALVKSLHPTWSPAEIKSAIAATAKDLAVSPMRQGAGRVDAMRAAAASTFLTPTNLSFGLDDPAQATWVLAETLTVYNRNAQSQTYQVVAPAQPAGVTITASPSNFTLQTDGERSVIVSISVSNTALPIVSEDIELYGGQVYFNGTIDTVHAPWGFVRTSRLLLTFDEPNASFIGGSNKSYFVSDYFGWMTKSRRLSPYSADVIGLAGGTYDVAAMFHAAAGASQLVIKEEVVLPESGGSLHIESTTATHALQFDAVDAEGVPLSNYAHSLRGLMVFFPTGTYLNNILRETSPGLLISPASARVRFYGVQAVADYSGTGTLVVPQFDSWSGMTGPISLTNDPAAYVHQTMRFAVPPDHPEARIFTELFVMQTTTGGDEGLANIYLVDTAAVHNGFVEFESYLSPEVGPKYSLATLFHVNYSDLATNWLDFETPYMTVRNDSLLNAVETQQDVSTFRSADGDTLVLNASPAHMEYVPYNNSFGPGTIQFLAVSRSPLGEFRYDDLTSGTYTIKNSTGDVVVSGSLTDPRTPLEVPVGVYTTELVTSNNYLRGHKGSVISRHRYDLSQPFPSPPTVTLYRVLDQRGRLSQTLRHNEHGSLRFGFKVLGEEVGYPLADSTKAYYRVHGQEAWTPIDVAKIADLPRPGSYFSVGLSDATTIDSVAIDLRIVTVEKDGNATELMVLPAFAVGNWQGQATTKVEEPSSGVPIEYALQQNYPNPFNPETNFELRIADVGSVKLSVFDMLGREVATLMNEEKLPGTYHVTWNASGMPTGVYYYRMTAGGFTKTRKMLLLK